MYDLNPQQRAAVEYLDSPLLVIAGAGSGKTRVITEKIAYLIQKANYSPAQIAAITFTNKAAQEMRERATRLLIKKHHQSLTVCTFHALGMRIVREESDALDLKKQFSILDASDTAKILSELLGSSGKEQVFKLQHTISLWKNALISPEKAFQAAQNEWEKSSALIYASYQETLKAYQSVDFDDLISLPCQLFAQHSEIQHRWQMRLRYLLVDECQDTNTCQYHLLNHLVNNHDNNFTAVGDDDQSIYAWRGADADNLRRLQTDYPQLKVIKLEQNYRSSARILRVANAVIANNTRFSDKKLWSEYGLGEPIEILSCQNETHEAETVVQKIADHQRIHRTQYADYAILYRGNHQAKAFEEALRSARIPYHLSGGQSFFDRAEIKDVLAYIRLLANPDDDPAFIRALTTPKRGVGQSSLTILNQLAKEHNESLFAVCSRSGSLSALSNGVRHILEEWMHFLNRYQQQARQDNAGKLMTHLLEEIAYQNYLQNQEEGKLGDIKWRNTQELCAWLNKKGEAENKTLFDLAQTIALMNLLEGKEKENDAVKLSTLHAAKGLEYAHVFLVGCEEGLFPHADSVYEGRLEEERRLMYVGITRARQTLTLTHTRKRRRSGHWQFIEPSRFIDEMPEEDIRILGRKDSAPIVSKEEGKAKMAAMAKMLAEKQRARQNKP